MSTAKKVKLISDSERSFQDTWTESFGVIERNGKALCILCSDSVVSRTSSVRHHFETNHKSVAELNEAERKEFLQEKLKKYHAQSTSFCKYLSQTNHLTEASFQMSLCIAKHGKPHSDGDFLKAAILAGSNSLLMIFQTRIKLCNASLRYLLAEILLKILRMASDVSQQITTDLQKAACYSMCLDERTDLNNHAGLAVICIMQLVAL